MSKGIYKPGQGYWTRLMSAIAAGLIVLLGAYWLWDILVRLRFGEIPPIYVAAGAAVIVVAALGALVYYYIALKPSSVDFLIATEGEMKKVNWSTRREIFGSTWVVIALTLLIAIFVFFFDRIFALIFYWMGVLDA